MGLAEEENVREEGIDLLVAIQLKKHRIILTLFKQVAVPYLLNFVFVQFEKLRDFINSDEFLEEGFLQSFVNVEEPLCYEFVVFLEDFYPKIQQFVQIFEEVYVLLHLSLPHIVLAHHSDLHAHRSSLRLQHFEILPTYELILV